MVSEVCLSLVLVAGAGLLARSFWHLRSIDPGFRSDHVLVVDASFERLRGDVKGMLPEIPRVAGARARPAGRGGRRCGYELADRPGTGRRPLFHRRQARTIGQLSTRATWWSAPDTCSAYVNPAYLRARFHRPVIWRTTQPVALITAGYGARSISRAPTPLASASGSTASSRRSNG